MCLCRPRSSLEAHTVKNHPETHSNPDTQIIMATAIKTKVVTTAPEGSPASGAPGAQEANAGGQLEGKPAGRFIVETVSPNGKGLSHESFEDADKAMRAFVYLTKVDFGKEFGIGAYVALSDTDGKLDAARIAQGMGTYDLKFMKDDGRLAFEAMEKTVKLEEAKAEMLGSVDGVLVVQGATGGYSVSFDFNRELSKMMDRVPGAVFDKAEKAYQVPEAGFGVLSKTVAAMRHETRSAQTALEGIMALAQASGIQAQQTTEVKPQISTFREPGKFYGGEIVNVNSHYAAQMCGFGNKDGAAFITVHKLADVDRDSLMKGDQVGIRYDNKFFGTVSDLSKNMSVAEFNAHYEENLGTFVDGVMVMDCGDTIGLAFDIHPVLVPRIRMVEGAAFNRDEGYWEVPKAKQEFALRAAEDMRKEFSLDSKEVAKLTDVAANKIDGAKIFKAFTKDGTSYVGTVVDVGDRYALQKTGRDGFTLHHLSALDQKPEKGVNLAIRYNKGVGAVVDQDIKREQGLGR